MFETSLAAVFLTGLFGGLHCAGMCGGIVSALSFRAPVAKVTFQNKLAYASIVPAVKSTGCSQQTLSSSGLACGALQQQLITQLLYNAGRLSTYTLLGALAGAVGSVGWWINIALPMQQAAFFLTNVLLIIMGLYLGGVKRAGRVFEILGRGLWQRISPHAIRQLKSPGCFSALMAGALWGLVPCGMVYAVLLAALLAGGAFNGAALMLVFGLGTLPGLLALGTAGSWLRKQSKHPRVRQFAGLIVVTFAVFGLLRLDIAERLPVVGALCSHLPDLNDSASSHYLGGSH